MEYKHSVRPNWRKKNPEMDFHFYELKKVLVALLCFSPFNDLRKA